MRLSLVTQRIQTTAQLASKAVSTKTNVPVLSNLLLTATKDNQLKIESSDLEISIKVAIQAKVDEPGQITVPAKTFTEYISTIKNDTVTLSSDGNQLMVSDGTNDASFVTMPAQDFPELPTYETQSDQAFLDPSLFRSLVKQTVFASASGDIHPVLTGVIFVFKHDHMVDVVATDSFRLSIVTVPFEGNLEGSFIVPASALRDVDGLLADASAIDASDAPLTFMASSEQNQVFIKVGIVEVISRLLDAQYPDYQRIIPTEFVSKIELSAATFLDAVKTTAIFAEREGQSIKIMSNPLEGTLSLSAQSSAVGTYKGSSAATITGDAHTLGFNARYLVDAIQSIASDTLVMNISGPTQPTVFTGKDDAAYRHIVMPMTLTD